jgi:hypothetical protein
MTDTRPATPYGWATLVALAVLAIYLLTLAPTTAFWDTSEYIAAAKVLGIPHPPGNPLFTVMAHAFALIPLAATYAVRLNLFAAVTSAAAAGLWFLVAERWLREIVPNRPARLIAATGGVLVSAFSWTVWNQSTVNEKVYTVSLFSMALVTWLAVHWGDDEPGPHRDRWLVLIVYILALSSTNHMMGFLAAPAVAVYVLWTDWRAATRPWIVLLAYALLLAVTGQWTTMFTTASGFGFNPTIGDWGPLIYLAPLVLGYAVWQAPHDFQRPLLWVGLIAVVVGVSLNYVYLPIRAAQFPPINEGEPTSWQALMDVLSRKQYLKPPLGSRQADLVAQFANYWQYFTWQFARDWGAFAGAATGLFTMIGLGGLAALLKRDLRAGLAAAAMLGMLTVALVYYLNFKYGFSIYPERSDLAREVRERDYFFVGSFAYFGVLVALGLGAAMRAVVDFGRQANEAVPETRLWAMATPLALVALVPLLGNRVTASRANEYMARDVAIDLLQSVEPYGILITAGDNDTFPLWYAQEVEGVRPDVTLANLSLMNTKWHLKQLSRRVTPEFDPEGAAPMWRDGEWTRPEAPALRLTIAEIDSLPELIRVEPGTTIEVGGIPITLQDQYVERKDLAAISMIQDNVGSRVIHFAWSAAGYPDQTLSLTAFLVTQGLVRRLSDTQVEASDSVVFNPTMGFLNVPRTRELLWNVYRWETAADARPRGWIDPPSASILQLYAVVFNGTSAVLSSLGETVEAARADSISQAVQRNIQP